jgi:hypothetical protein
MKTTLALLCAALLSGCASTAFENRIMTTLDGGIAQVSLRFGNIALSLDLAPEDAAEIAKLKRQAALAGAGFTGK